MPTAQEFGTIFAQKVDTACAIHASVEQIAEQKMHALQIVELESVDLNFGHSGCIIFATQELLDFLDCQQISQPGILIGMSNPKPAIAITALVSGSCMNNRS